MIAAILTPWTGTGSETNPYRPLIADIYPIHSWIDITAQPAQELQPEPNLFIIQASLDKATLNAISTDNRFYILWEKE